jgi:hypothetical protein
MPSPTSLDSTADGAPAERFRRPGPWTAVPSHIARDRGYMGCSLAARHMHLMAWLYCNRERTDGNLSKADFRNVAAESQLSESEAEEAARELVSAALWRPGYELADFLRWNLSAQEIEKRAAENAERVKAFRAAQKVSPHPFQKTEIQNTQNTQVRTRVRNGLQRKGIGEPAAPSGPPAQRQKVQAALEVLVGQLNGQGRTAVEA